MHRKKFAPDPRYFQLVFLLIFLGYGWGLLGWQGEWMQKLLCIGACLIFNYGAEYFRRRKYRPADPLPPWACWGPSALISALSICLLLKTNRDWVILLAALLAISSKYLLRFRGKHLFNPSAFGMVCAVLLTGRAWISPGQWGNGAAFFFLAITLGTIVVTRVQKLDSSLAFLFTYAFLYFCRQSWYLGWPADYLLQTLSNGSLLLFSFFMISDPKTSPNHPLARIAWALGIAGLAFWLSGFQWVNGAPLYALVAAAPAVPLLDILFPAGAFAWKADRPAKHLFFHSKIFS
jgi:hypothetical protein